MKTITASEVRGRVRATLESCGLGLADEKVVDAIASRLVEAYSEGYKTALLSRRNDYAVQILAGMFADAESHGVHAQSLVHHCITVTDELLSALTIERRPHGSESESGKRI